MHLSRTERFRIWWQLYVLRRDWAFITAYRREFGFVIRDGEMGRGWYTARKVLGPFYRRPRRGFFRDTPAV